MSKEGSTHPRAPNLVIPGAWVGVWGRSIGNDPRVVQWGSCSRHFLTMLKAGEWQSSRQGSSCIVSLLRTEITSAVSQRDWF